MSSKFLWTACLLLVICLCTSCNVEQSSVLKGSHNQSSNADKGNEAAEVYMLEPISEEVLTLPQTQTADLVVPELPATALQGDLKRCYLKWRSGNHLKENGDLVDTPGYAQAFLLPEPICLPWEEAGSRAGAVILMVPNGTPDELPGEYCVSTDEAMGYGLILSAQFGDWDLFNRLLRVCLYYANYNAEGKAEDSDGWDHRLTTWAIPALKGKNWFETDYFKGLSPAAQAQWRESGVQYDPAYLEGTRIPESVILGVENTNENCGGSAMDGELDIAYALYLASARHPDRERAIAYKSLARDRYKGIMSLVENYGTVESQLFKHFLPTGDYRVHYQDEKGARYMAITRPCDWMNAQLRAYYYDTGDVRAKHLIEANYAMLQQVADQRTGLVPDFGVFKRSLEQDTLMPAEASISNEWMSEHFYMNSARYPFRIAMDSYHYGEQRGIDSALKIVDFFIERYGFHSPEDFESLPPAIHSLNGDAISEGLWQNPVLNAALYSAASMSGKEQYLEFVTMGWQHLSNRFDSRRYDWDANGLGLDPSHSGYFQDTWALLAMLVMSGHWTPPINSVQQ